MSDTQALPIFSDLMAKTGYFVLHWSSFELTLQEAILQARERQSLDPASVGGGLKDRLDLWVKLVLQLPENRGHAQTAKEVCEQALNLREVRNIIVHGLLGGDAQPKDGAPAHIRCMEGGFEAPTGKTVQYTMTDLEHYAQGIDACRRALTNVSNFNYRLDA